MNPREGPRLRSNTAEHIQSRPTAPFWWADDVLEPADLAAATAYARAMPYRPADQRSGSAIWRQPGRSNPDASPHVIWADHSVHARFLRVLPELLVYPTATPLDLVLELVRATAGQTQIFREDDSVGIVATAYRYEAGTGLAFHDDDEDYAAAFTLYLGESWNNDWGGHLMLADPRGDAETGSGTYLTPRPNRLVLIRRGHPHGVGVVRAPPGAARLSLSGFFVRAGRLGTIIRKYMPTGA